MCLALDITQNYVFDCSGHARDSQGTIGWIGLSEATVGCPLITPTICFPAVTAFKLTGEEITEPEICISDT
jgi:hypothetical protein